MERRRSPSSSGSSAIQYQVKALSPRLSFPKSSWSGMANSPSNSSSSRHPSPYGQQQQLQPATAAPSRSPLSDALVASKAGLTFSDDLFVDTSPISLNDDKDNPLGIEAEIAKEIEQLSESDRQQIGRDVEGRNPIVVSVGEPIRLADIELQSLDREFHKIIFSSSNSDIGNESASYRPQHDNDTGFQDLIPFINNDYVRDPTLRMRMLRAEHYDCSKAALRLAKFLQLLHETFGSDLLMRPIHMSDLSVEEKRLQRLGLLQLFKFRDNAGRRIAACFDAKHSLSGSILTQLRVALYLMQVASDDEDTQHQGIVCIFMLAGNNQSGKPKTVSNCNASTSYWQTTSQVLNRIFQCAPVRVGAIHICAPDGLDVEVNKSILLNGLDANERHRSRFHNGSSMEVSMALNAHGIPTDRLPLKYDGTVKIEDHLQWIAVREAKEEAIRQLKSFDVVECPMNMDILSGRGQLVRNHPGNISFRKDFIQARSSQYNAAHTRDEKNEIATTILYDIAGLGRQFLKQHPSGYWCRLEAKLAKEKVMMAFREYRKSQRLEESRCLNNAQAFSSSSSSCCTSTDLTMPFSHDRDEQEQQQQQSYHHGLQYHPYHHQNSSIVGNIRQDNNTFLPNSYPSSTTDEPTNKKYKTGYG